MPFLPGASPAHRPPGFYTNPPAGTLPVRKGREEFTPQLRLVAERGVHESGLLYFYAARTVHNLGYSPRPVRVDLRSPEQNQHEAM